MSQYSPTVQPTSGRAFARALGQGLDAFFRARQQKRQEGIEDTERQRAEAIQNATLGEQGIHLIKPGELPPTFDINVSGGPDANAIVDQATTPRSLPGTGGSLPGATAIPRHSPGAQASNTPTGQPLAVALSRHLSMGPGYYVDQDERAQHQAESMSLAANLALAKALGAARAQDIVDPTARTDKHDVAQSTVRRNEAQANRPASSSAPRVVRTQEGMFLLGADGSVTPLEANGQPLHAPLTSRSPNPNAETPVHRSARQGFSATQRLLTDTQREVGQMDRSAPPLVRYPGVVTGTPQDSADARGFTTRRNALVQRADSLRSEADQYSRTMGGGAARTPSRSPAPAAPLQAQPDYDREAALYKAGIARIKQNFTGAERDKRLQAASDRYNERVRALATGQQP